jgi:hypothetical protein
MLDIFLMLTCTVSLILHGAIDVTVHNQYSDIKLVSPVYFCNRGIYNEYPVERTDIGAIMKAGFRFDVDQDKSGGALMYEMQRKGNTKSDHQPRTDATSTKAVEDTQKMMKLLVTWKITYSEGLSLRVRMMLVEHDNELVLNEDELAQLYDKVNSIPTGVYTFFIYDGIFKSTWLACDNTVLETTYRVSHENGFELKTSVSEGVKDKDTKSTLWIDSER